ncbi:hypothetical protein [Neolewinella antarctica]|uniref:Uncharacterized protein n=1 Tax=Neolewinella antarctica TaxID=442734 RepID=A0ABX0XB35_9BACT|nr:hypothetical protein [Neolewinella antarctica]NJC26427.1 hypothetical protein [Neolewinella antarctica]
MGFVRGRKGTESNIAFARVEGRWSRFSTGSAFAWAKDLWPDFSIRGAFA